MKRLIETSTSFRDLQSLIAKALEEEGLALSYVDADGDKIILKSQDGPPLSCHHVFHIGEGCK